MLVFIKPIFCAVIEPLVNWMNSASLLITSLRENGGQFADSPFVVLLNGENEQQEILLQNHANAITIVSNYRQPIIPHMSKITALKLTSLFDFTHLVLLDHDTIILHLNDFAKYVNNKVYARQNYKYGLWGYLGNNYADYLNESIPWSKIPYFNSGVSIIPREYCQPLEKNWMHWANVLKDAYHKKPLAEQIAFAMAIAHEHIPYGFLPMIYNQTHWKPPSNNAAIIHYNAYDPMNKEVKNRILWSFPDFEHFLNTTENRFWRMYRSDIKKLLNPSLTNFRKILRQCEPISVIIPTVNRLQSLQRAILSVENQDYPGKLEIILATSNTNKNWIAQLQRIRQNCKKSCVICEYPFTKEDIEKNPLLGFYRPAKTAKLRNIGAQAAKGKYLAFLDDDNELQPSHISSLADVFVYNPKAQVAHSWRTILWSDGAPYTEPYYPWIKQPNVIHAHYIYQELLAKGIFQAGSSAMNDQLATSGSEPLLTVDSSEWLMERSFAQQFPFPEVFTFREVSQNSTEDYLLCKHIAEAHAEVYCSHMHTLNYYLGGATTQWINKANLRKNSR